MPCSQPEDGDLLGSVHLVDMVFLRSHLQTLPPCGFELASQDGFGNKANLLFVWVQASVSRPA